MSASSVRNEYMTKFRRHSSPKYQTVIKVGFWYGSTRPFLVKLWRQCWVFYPIGNGVYCSTFVTKCQLVDTACTIPVIAYINQVKNLAESSGCEQSIQRGEYKQGKMTLFFTGSRVSTDREFLNKKHKGYHTGQTSLPYLLTNVSTRYLLDFIDRFCVVV